MSEETNDSMETESGSSSVGHQLIAFTIDQQFKSFLTSTLNKTLEAFNWNFYNEYFKIDLECIVDLIYTFLSFEASKTAQLTDYIMGAPSVNSSDTTPGMRAMGLSWAQRGSTLLYLALTVINHCLHQLRKISLSEGDLLLIIVNHEVLIPDLDISLGWKNNFQNKWKQNGYQLIRILLICGKCLSMSNFIYFLVKGDYPTFLHRITGFQMVRIYFLLRSKCILVNSFLVFCRNWMIKIRNSDHPNLI
jgi:hypothetical protein